MASTPYLELLDAVESYYGAGSDEWLQIATSSNIQSTEWYNILSQTPGVNITTNKAGEIISYTVDKSWGTAAGSATSVVNSNTQAAELANAGKLYYPANTTINPTTGEVAATSGMTNVSSGAAVSTVVKDVALGIAAVATGIRAGAALDSALYNINPQWWNEHNMAAYNPQTWDSIATTQFGKDVINAVFGINKQTGTSQMYLEDKAFAYIIGYMAKQGMFSTDGGSASIDTPTGLEPSVIEHQPYRYGDDVVYTGSYISGSGAGTDPATNGLVLTAHSLPVYTFATEGVSENHNGIYACSRGNFTGHVDYHNEYGSYTRTIAPTHYTINDNDFYVATVLGQTPKETITVLSPMVIGYFSGSENVDDIAYIILYGYRRQGMPGVTPQPGATLPTTITGDESIEDILTKLRVLYPDLFTDDAITNTVIQPDGTPTTRTYVPVGFPDDLGITETSTGTDVRPTGGISTTQAHPSVNPSTTPESLIDELIKVISSTNPNNPKKPGETTDYPDTGDGTTPVIVTPTGSASALYSVYNPSQSQLNSFGAWLWSSNFVDQLLKVFNDPMQAIIGLHKIFATPPTSGTGDIKVGYLNSGVSANLVSSQYTEVNCGSVNLREYFGNALDYTDTDIYIYLPFIGIMPINTKDVMRSTINVKYKVDVLTGACLAVVNVNRDNNAGGQLYCYSGNCAVQYPLSSGSYMGIVTGILGVAGAVAGTIATGGSVLPMALGVGASALGSSKTQVQHSGSITGNAGAMGVKKPYLIIRRPQTKIAAGYEVFNGVSNNKTVVLSSLTGFTKVNYINLENIHATDNELSEIKSLLTTGVII